MPTTFTSFDVTAIGRRLRIARDRAGVSRAFAARRAGLSRSELDLVEHGVASVSVETLAVLSLLYNCQLDWLLTGAGTSPMTDTSDGNQTARQD